MDDTGFKGEVLGRDINIIIYLSRSYENELRL